MKTWLKVLIVTLVVGIPTVPLGQVIWRAPADAMQPSGGQLPFFIALSVVEGLLFGLGVAFLVFGYPLVRNIVRGPNGFTWAAYLSVAWLLVSWWPHDNFHRVTPHEDFGGLLGIEYSFHLTLMAAGAIVAYYFIRSVAARTITQEVVEPRTSPATLQADAKLPMA